MRLLHPHLLVSCCWCHILCGAPKACALSLRFSIKQWQGLVMQGLLTTSTVRTWSWHQQPLHSRLQFWPTEGVSNVQGLSIYKQDGPLKT